MHIIKNIRDLSLNEDQEFFANLIKDEFGCNSCAEEIKNKDFMQYYARPMNDFNIYNTAQPTAEGTRMLAWKRKQG